MLLTLGSIYLPYVLNLWFEKVVRKHCKGELYIVRYCDDFVSCFQYEHEAKSFYEALKKRLAKFNLEVAEDKTKIFNFGSKACFNRKFGRLSKKNRHKTFNFLGFTHYCSCRNGGSFRVKRKTSGKKFRASLQKVKIWLRENMHVSLDILVKKLNRKLVGYYRYYGITDNADSLSNFKDCIKRQLYKTLNRRSQRRSYNWKTFAKMMKVYKLANPKIYVNIFELRSDISYIL